MNFVQGELETALRDSLDRFLTDRYDFQTRRREPQDWQSDIWKAFAEELGLLGAALPEAVGGLGGGAAETGAIMERLGRFLVREPYLSTVVMGGAFLRDADGEAARGILEAIIAGSALVAIAFGEDEAVHAPEAIATRAEPTGEGFRLTGRKTTVLDAATADWLIVTARSAGAVRDRDGVSLFLVDARSEGIERLDFRTLDGASASTLILDGVLVPRAQLIGGEGRGLPLLERVMDEATAAVCAEACGVMQAMLDQTLEYTRQRKQFGRAIAENQVIQHRMVDMLIALKEATSLTMVARAKLDTPDRAAAVSAAKSRVAQACRFVAQSAIQLHGAIGITDEMAISHYFRRGLMLERLFGSSDYHLDRYEKLQIEPG